jgi:hypothetical protein
MLTVDGDQLAAMRRKSLNDERTTGQEALLVGETEAIPRLERSERRREPRGADNPVDDCGAGSSSEVGNRLGPELDSLLEDGIDRSVRRGCNCDPSIGMTGGNVGKLG